ncbi:MAG: CRTAC1 family protein, partial [Bacteroidia bacterium]|nr:CRTAC1 family protein [Bacteroidia bacterium]
YGYSYGGLTSNVNAATATISGFDSVCNNNTGTLRFDFTGGPPWSVVYSDGVNSYNLNNITSTPYFLPVTVTSNKVFTIKSFISNGVASANVFGKAYTKLAISNQSAQISGAKTICSGDSTQLIIRLTGSKPVSFTYTDGTTPVTVSGITDSVYRVFVSPTTTKTYSLVNVKDICGNNGSITGSALITVIPAIIAPSNFKLTDNDRKILLEWTDNSSNEDSIIVERKMQGQTSFSRLKVLLPNTIQYLDTNIAYQKWYYYKVTFKKNNVSCIGVSEIDSIYADYPPSKFLVNTLFNPGNSTNIKNAVWFDVDNDGDLDIIFGSMCVYKNNGSGGFEFSYNFSGALLDSVNGSTLRVTDVNNDGRTDYFLLNAKVNGIAKAIVLTDNGYFNMVAGPFDYSNYDNVTWPDNYIDFINYNNDKRLDIIANYYKVINTPFNPYNGTYAGVDVNTTSAQTSPNPNFILQRSRLYDNMTKFGKTFYLDLNNDNFQDLISFGSNGVHVFKFADNIFESKFEDSGVVNGLISNYNVQMSDFDNNLVSEFVFQMPFIKQKSGTGLNTYTNLNANYGDFNSTNANGCKTFAIEDFNNDGWQDVFMTYTNKAPVLFLNNKNKTFSKYDFGYIAPAETKAAELVLGDYDIDGKVDIAIGNRILRNTLPFNNNWINIKLLPVSTNRIPYGARVRIKAIINGQPVWQQREITANGNSTIAHFGLGNAVKIDSIVVLWPNHTKSDSALRSTGISNVTTLQNISTINQQIEIVEPTRVLQFLEFAASVTKASLKWNKISGANNYLLKRRSVKDTAFRQVYIGNNIVFEDTTLLPNSVYEYILYSFSYGDTLKESVYVTTDKIRIKAETTNGLTNIISWNGTESSTIKNMLYRKKANGQFQFVKDVKRLSSYIDTLVMPSEQYCYFIQSFYS